MPEQEPIPKAYTSDITLFECPGCIAKYTLSQFIELFHDTGIIRPDYIHELWRTGRQELIYEILKEPGMTIRLEDIAETGHKTLIQGADLDEVEGFLTDVIGTIVKVNTHKEYDYELTEVATEVIRLQVEGMMQKVEELVPLLPE